MILYFSGTGNSKYAALQLAKQFQDTAYSIRHLMDAENYDVTIKDGECFGFVCPIYWEALPTIVTEFLEKVKFHLEGNNHYCYFVATYGNDYGNIFSIAKKVFGEKGINFNSLFDLFTAGNWGPYYDLKARRYLNRIARVEEKELERISGYISRRESGLMPKDELSKEDLQKMQAHYHRIRHTSLFRVDTAKCVHCGLCERLCPVHAIRIKDGHPEWVKEQCTLCLGCLSYCPSEAIDYEEGFLKYGRYTHPGIEPDLEKKQSNDRKEMLYELY